MALLIYSTSKALSSLAAGVRFTRLSSGVRYKKLLNCRVCTRSEQGVPITKKHQAWKHTRPYPGSVDTSPRKSRPTRSDFPSNRWQARLWSMRLIITSFPKQTIPGARPSPSPNLPKQSHATKTRTLPHQPSDDV